MQEFNFREIFQVMSEILGELADRSKLPDTDDNGLQFFRHDDNSGFTVRFVTMDNIDITFSLDRDQLGHLAKDPNTGIGEIALAVVKQISDKRRDRHEKGETTILIPTQSQLSAAIQETMKDGRG